MIIDINKIIIIQKYYRRYLVQKKLLIPSSYYQTKIWRKNRKWYNNGKSNECEKYQINNIEKIIFNTSIISTFLKSPISGTLISKFIEFIIFKCFL